MSILDRLTRTDTTPEIEPATAHDLLASERRRRALRELRAADPTVLKTLARRVAAAEQDTDPDGLADPERKRVYVSLYQTHLPRLEGAGVIEWAPESGRVALADTDAARVVCGLLDDEAEYWEVSES